ncbi:hypothetical protein HYV89_05280 [Candidatus Woesearchaeota archaeon]|nr:hypothetical protein [Candidatus Woesearchaeota archaeon]
METLQTIGVVFAIIGTFIGLNIFLISMTKDTADIIFGNIFLLMTGHLTYLTLAVYKLKEERR